MEVFSFHYMYIHVCVHTYTYIYIHAYINRHLYICIFMYMNVYIYTYWFLYVGNIKENPFRKTTYFMKAFGLICEESLVCMNLNNENKNETNSDDNDNIDNNDMYKTNKIINDLKKKRKENCKDNIKNNTKDHNKINNSANADDKGMSLTPIQECRLELEYIVGARFY